MPKILIYSESEEAKALAEKLREDKNNEVYIRTADPAYFDAEKPEPADIVHCWTKEHAHAYADAEMHYHGETVKEEKPVETPAKKAPAKKTPTKGKMKK